MLTLTTPQFALHDGCCGTTRTLVAAGDLDLSVAARFGAAVTTALDSGAETVVLDLGDLGFIDSAGIHALLRANRRAANGGTARLIIRPGSDRVQRVFELCGVAAVLPFVEASA
jgi:anti-sigma B factor antagonist